jgi:hypothetical protein
VDPGNQKQACYQLSAPPAFIKPVSLVIQVQGRIQSFTFLLETACEGNKHKTVQNAIKRSRFCCKKINSSSFCAVSLAHFLKIL